MQKDVRNIKTICPNCFATLDAHTDFCFNCKTRNSPIPQSSATLPPRTLLSGRYLVGTLLGRGGFGITYNGWDMMLSRRVAIKEFFPKGYTMRMPMSTSVTVTDPNNVAAFNYWLNAFVQEAKVLTSIKHMHGIVKILDFFLTNNTAYIVMDFLEGISLKKYLELRDGKINLNETLNIIRPILETLMLLHQHGVIHKDISPDNIQIVQNKYVKLIDFGAASLYTQMVSKPFFVLKKGYSPIELHNPSMPQGPWTDVYQVGATIYCCLTGAPPPESVDRYKSDRLIRPSQLGVMISQIRENSLLKSLAIDPAARYSNVGEFIQMLYGEVLPRTHQRY